MVYFPGMADKDNGGFDSPGLVSEKELRASEWWVNHRDQVRNVAIGVFALFDLVLLGVGVWGFTDWLAFGGVNEQRALREMTSPAYGRFAGVGLEELQVGAPIVLPGGSGKIDVLVPVENRNPRFWAELDYHLTVGGLDLPPQRSFVLPGQAKYLSALGVSTEAGAGIDVRVDRRVWHHADTPVGLDQQAYAETRLNLVAENAVFKPSDPLATSPSSSAAFTLANHSAFGFYDVDLLVLLYRGDAVVSANRVRVDRVLAGEKKPMEIFWYQLLPQVTRVEVLPDINIYDPDVFRPPGA